MTNNEKELLELAAKAAGIYVEGFTLDSSKGMRLVDDDHNFVNYWNPREDDAQCLQLARKLVINIDYENCCAWKRGVKFGERLTQKFWGEGHWEDDKAAVVAVAAELYR
jgi:hypothetical protein